MYLLRFSKEMRERGRVVVQYHDGELCNGLIEVRMLQATVTGPIGAEADNIF